MKDKKEKPKWYNLYFASWFPIQIWQLILIVTVCIIVAILGGFPNA